MSTYVSKCVNVCVSRYHLPHRILHAGLVPVTANVHLTQGPLSLAPFGFLAAREMPAMVARLAAGSRPASPWLPMRSGSRGGPAVGPARAPGPAWTEARCVARCGCVFGPPTGLPLSAGCALILASAYVRPGLASWGVRLSLRA